MKKIIMGLALTLIATTSYAEAFKCTGYINAESVGEAIIVNASKKSVAETKALGRILKKTGVKVDYVRCR